MLITAWIFLLVPCFAFGGEPPSTLAPLSQQFKVADLPNRDSRGGLALAMDGSGNFVVLWSVRHGEKRFDGDGKELSPSSVEGEATRGNEFQINDQTTGNQKNPNVGMDREGNFVVVWQSSGQDGSGEGIFAKRYDAQGRELAPPPGLKGKGSGNEFQISRETRQDQEWPSVSMTPRGAFVVAWQGRVFPKNQGGISAILAQRHDSEGRRIGEEFRVNISSARAIAGIALASAPDGSLLIAWADEFQQRHTWARRYEGGDRLGMPRGLEKGDGVFRVSSYNGEHFTTAQGAVVEATGGFLVAFSSLQDEDGFGVFAKRFDSEGNEIPPVPELVGDGVENEFQVNSYSHSTQGLGDVASEGRRSVIVWASREQDGDLHGVFAKAYDAAGRKISPPAVLRGEGVGNEFRVNRETRSDQYGVSVAMGPDGGFMIVWRGRVFPKNQGGLWAILGRCYDVAAGRMGPEFPVVVVWRDPSPALAAGADGSYLVAWPGEGEHVRGKRFGSSCHQADTRKGVEAEAWRNAFQVSSYNGNHKVGPFYNPHGVALGGNGGL